MRDDLPLWLVTLCTVCASIMFFWALHMSVLQFIRGAEIYDAIDVAMSGLFFGMLFAIGVNDFSRRWVKGINLKMLFYIVFSVPFFLALFFTYEEYMIWKSHGHHPKYLMMEFCKNSNGTWDYDAQWCDYLMNKK